MRTNIFATVVFVLLAWSAQAGQIQNDLPTPIFDGRADADSFDDHGSGAATCTPTDVTFVEDPPGSGKYAAEFNGTTSSINCGTGLDGLHSSGTRLIYVKPDTLGEGSLGHIYAKQTDTANRSWDLTLFGDGVNTCTGGTAGDCFSFTNFSTANAGTAKSSPRGTVSYSGYTHITGVLSCSSSTIQSCGASRLYVNGFPVAITANSNTGTIRTADSGDSFIIGNRVAGDRAFDGRIKRTVVFAENLNQFQVEASYYRTLALDTPEEAPDAVTQSDCDTLMASFNAAAGQADPFERTAGEFTLGNGCAPFQGVPGR
jgi:hypothetical protein